MSTDRNSWGWGRNLLWASVMPLAMVGVTLLVAIGIGVIPLNGCDAERKKKISNLAGLDFEVTDTDCDVGLYKGAAMSVFVSKTGEGEKALLFKFEPEDDDLLPEIKVEQQNSTILVSISRISSIYLRKDRWRNMTVKYDIGHTDYPRADKIQDQASPIAK
jgi:hypothetical protein